METRVLHDPGVGWARPVRRPEPPSPSVGRTLAAARRARRLSLREVADTMGMPPSRLAGYENGEQLPQPVTLRRLCAALGLTPSVLLRLRLAATTGKGRSVEDDHDSGIDAGPDDWPGRNRVADLPDIDPLTGLPGPAWLERRAAELIGTIARHPGTRAVGLLIGIDGFARVNDALGRQAGDRVLVELARRLEAAAGAGVLVARIGGDIFAALAVRSAETDQHEGLADRLLGAMGPPSPSTASSCW